MGKLIILSGPSCVGKGPLVKTLGIYLKSINKSLKKHVIYNTRKKRDSEIHGEDYWYSYLLDVEKENVNNIIYSRKEALFKMIEIWNEAIKDKQEFDIFQVREDLQGLDYSVLEQELKDNDIVLLEIFQKKVNDVVTFCNKKGYGVKRIFVSPLSDDDYKNKPEEFSTDAGYTESIMRAKLIKRGKDSSDSIDKRAKKAIEEVEEARKLRDKGEILYFVNRFGEDMKTAWDSLRERVGKKTFMFSSEEIDKTFRQFLDQVFPEILKHVPEHNCEDNLNVCTCKICGKRVHDIDWGPSYGSGTGRVDAKCRRCGAYDSFYDDTGTTIETSNNW